MKRLSFILAAAVVFAVGSAFTTAKPINPKFLSKTYYHVGNSFQSTALRPGLTCQPDDVCCRIVFSGTSVPTAVSFAENAIPTGSWTATEELADASLQEQ